MSNIKFALRQLAKSPGFATVALLTLALGIGACTAMFSTIYAVLLRPLPFRDPGRLAWIENVGTGGLSARTTRADTFKAWREENTSFEAIAGYFAFFDFLPRRTLTGSGDPERLRSVAVSDNFLDVLGVTLAVGRNFTADECRVNAAPVAILSHALWRRRFASDPGIIGRTVTANNAPLTIVGVLPSTFDFDAIFSPGTEVDLMTPFPIAPETARYGNTLFAIGRLKPGATPEAAQADLQVISERFKQSVKYGGTLGARVSRVDDALRGSFRPAFYRQTGDWQGMEMVVRSARPAEPLARDVRAALASYDPSLPTGEFYELERLVENAVAPRRLTTQLLGFFSALALALAAIALYGVIAQSVVQRTQEIGIRMAIGAQRQDVLRMVLLSGLRLVSVGVALGLAGAFALTRVLQTLLFGVTAHDPITFAGNAVLLVFVATAACLLPALRATRVNPIVALRAE